MKPVEELRFLNKTPQKRMGQHFLVDEKVLADVVAAGEVTAADTVVEIGPGLGALTMALVQRAGRVVAIEADRELAEHLRAKNIARLTVVTGDALHIDWTATMTGPYKIIANIPYSITSPLLQKIYRLEHRPTNVVLLVQKELAERLTAQPGNRDRGFMTVLSEANAAIRMVRSVKAGSFRPVPKVESAIITVTPLAESKMPTVFWPIVEAGFRHGRQTLVNGIAQDLPIKRPELRTTFAALGLNVLARPAELTFDQWRNLSQAVEKIIKTA